MPIVRGHHAFEAHFTQIPNAWLRDTRLSYKARGLLAELMTHSVGFQVSRERLARNGQDGDRAVRSAIAELEAAGYLKRSQSRSEDQRFAASIWTTCDPSEPSVRFAPADNAPADNATPKKKEEKKTEEEKEDLVQDELERAILQGFDDFWAAYPRRQARVEAFRAFRKAVKCHSAAEIVDGARRFATDPYLPPKQFIPMPATWLNQERWDDGPLPERMLTPEEKAAKAEAERLARYERDKIRRAQEAVEREAERIRSEKARASVTRCEHDRIAVMCPVCSREKSDPAA